jgi:hypothetical protein
MTRMIWGIFFKKFRYIKKKQIKRYQWLLCYEMGGKQVNLSKLFKFVWKLIRDMIWKNKKLWMTCAIGDK